MMITVAILYGTIIVYQEDAEEGHYQLWMGNSVGLLTALVTIYYWLD